jgi:hypothetical protein
MRSLPQGEPQKDYAWQNPSSQKLTLPLFEAWILLVDNIKLALPPHNLTIGTALFDGCTNFHDLLFISEYNPSPGQIVWAHLHPHLITRQNPDIIHPHFPGNGSQYFVPVFQLHFEHCIG